MFSRKALVIALAFAATVAAGNASASSSFDDAESGGARTAFIPGWMKSMVTGAQIQAGIAAFRMNPVSTDGQHRFVGGESGWERIAASYEIVDGKLARTDSLESNNAQPGVSAADFTRELLRAQMFNPSNG